MQRVQLAIQNILEAEDLLLCEHKKTNWIKAFVDGMEKQTQGLPFNSWGF